MNVVYNYILSKCRRWALQQAVDVAKERFAARYSGAPSGGIGNINIIGSRTFTQEVSDALHHLKLYPFGHALVHRYIRAVIERESQMVNSQLIGVVCQSTNEAGRIPVPANRFAAYLVRAALSTRFATGFQLPNSPRSELIRLKWELRAMKLLNCHPWYVRDQRADMERIRSSSQIGHSLTRLQKTIKFGFGQS